MDIRGPILNSMRQYDTPLANAFFCGANLNFLQKKIHDTVKQRSGISIDKQNSLDLSVIMRQIYLTNTFDPYGDVKSQVQFLNTQTLSLAVSQVISGIAQYIGFLKDNGTQPVPIPLPRSTTVYGNKIPYNNKIGL